MGEGKKNNNIPGTEVCLISTPWLALCCSLVAWSRMLGSQILKKVFIPQILVLISPHQSSLASQPLLMLEKRDMLAFHTLEGLACETNPNNDIKHLVGLSSGTTTS